MKIVKTILEIEIYDQKIEMRKPTFKESQQYRESLLKMGENGDAADVMMAFLESLGLPKEIFESLEFGHITQIMELVTGSKKN
jgi:hypothetical protein